MARSYLDFEGVYDKTKRYIVNNWSDEDFTQRFGSDSVYNGNQVVETQPPYEITIKSGEMRELGQFEAFTITRHLVDREMFKAAAKLTDRVERERAESGVNSRDVRKSYEDKTVQEILAGQATPFMEKLREEIRKEEIAKINVSSTEQTEASIEVSPEVKTEEKIDKRTKEYKEKMAKNSAGEFDGVNQ